MSLTAAPLLIGCETSDNHLTHNQREKLAAETTTNAALECGITFTPGSHIAREIMTLVPGATCKVGEDASGNRVRMFTVLGKVDPTISTISDGQDFASRLVVFAILYSATTSESTLPALDPHILNYSDDAGVVRNLNSKVSVTTSTGEVSGDTFMFSETKTKIDTVCLSTIKKSSAGTPLRILICRSVGRSVSDERLISVAQSIAASDIPRVNADRGG